MPWKVLAIVFGSGYVIGSAVIWQVEVFVLHNQRWRAVRWIYHVCFWSCIVCSFMIYGYIGPVVALPSMLLAAFLLGSTIGSCWHHIRVMRRMALGLDDDPNDSGDP